MATQTSWLLAFLAAMAIASLVAVCALRPRAASVALLLLAIPFLRPFIAGERYATIGVVLTGLAAAVALYDTPRIPLPRAARSFILWLTATWVWFTLQISWGAQNSESILRGWFTVWLALAFATVVLVDPVRRRLFTKGVIAATAVLCLAFAITFVLWMVFGFGSFLITRLPIGYKVTSTGVPATTPFYWPLTPTYSSFRFAGLTVPRMLGVGRESGVMALLIGWCLFTVKRVAWNRWWLYLFLLLGLAGTQSTAGFGVLLLVLVLHRLFLPQPGRFWPPVMRRTFGGLVLGAALWASYYAPIYGFQAKASINDLSVSDRQNATIAGLTSVTDSPFGRPTAVGEVAGINMIGALTVAGIIGVVLMSLALLRPLMLSSDPLAGVSAVVFVTITVVVAQPPQFSPGFYLLTLVASLGFHAEYVSSVAAAARGRSGTSQSPLQPEPAVASRHLRTVLDAGQYASKLGRAGRVPEASGKMLSKSQEE